MRSIFLEIRASTTKTHFPKHLSHRPNRPKSANLPHCYLFVTDGLAQPTTASWPSPCAARVFPPLQLEDYELLRFLLFLTGLVGLTLLPCAALAVVHWPGWVNTCATESTNPILKPRALTCGSANKSIRSTISSRTSASAPLKAGPGRPAQPKIGSDEYADRYEPATNL